MNGGPDPVYVQSRRVLLDALAALEPQLRSIILVGAQAVYLNTGESRLAVAPYTTDADLALDADSLNDTPLIETAMEAGGFVRGEQPGMWVGQGGVPIDLMVPEGQGGGGSRAARIPPHGKHVARKALGLEAALVDRDLRPIGALDATDDRSFKLLVAGPAALLVAKTIKIDERRHDPRRLKDKDALDILRLLQANEASEIAERMLRIVSDDRARTVATRGTRLISELFGRPDSFGCEMASRATAGLEDPDEIAASCAALAADLISVLDPACRG